MRIASFLEKGSSGRVLLYLLNLLWVAMRQRSVTIALIFALTLQGISVAGHLRELFRMMGVIWPAVWILPVILVWLLAKHETAWLPHQKLRTGFSLGLIFGSILLWMAMSRVEDRVEREAALSEIRSTNDVRRAERDAFRRLGTKN